ncbi:MAG: response regulator [Lachnospiraceae bacterium]|nr:response regulator [Lachnospiraceae bacterium]
MEERQFGNEKMSRKLEQIVLIFFTIFSLSMFVSSFLLAWHILLKELIIATVVAGWIVFSRKYRDYKYRAKFLAVMTWVNFAIYATQSVSFTSMLSTMLALIVLLGIFSITDIIYIDLFCATVIIAYHVFVLRTFKVETANEVLRLFLHILSAYAILFVTWITIRTRQETNEQLVEKIRELKIVEKSKDDFMVNISHEIRTPINAVCGMSEAILHEDIPVNVRRDIIDIQTAGRNLLATVSNILDFSELESGKMELAEESYNITSTVTDIINMALTLENGKQLELIVDCDANLPSNLLGDEQKFRRIVMNLMENAIKFTKEGGVILRIKSRKEEYGVNLLVSIKDSGIGMKQEDMENIFASFSQVNSGRNREEGGIGLGLAITQALVRNMGGFITVESEPGNGTEFQFTIPQKVLDETPIVSIRNKSRIFVASYINMDKYDYSVVREGYEKCMRHMAEQFGVMFRVCRNLSELKRRIENENYTHIFIGWEEYNEDKAFFEKMAQELKVVLILDYDQEMQSGSNMLRIYKPFTVLSIAAVLNGEKVLQSDEQHSRYRFVAPTAKVLVIDDNAMNLKVMARLLLPYQIKVVMALGGQEGLDKLNSMDYDCVFLDHMMPEMDGVETLHRIRQKPGPYFQTLPIIAFTANAIGGAREMFMEEGFDDFIAKPIELSVLERMLQRYIPQQKQVKIDPQMQEDADVSGKNGSRGGRQSSAGQEDAVEQNSPGTAAEPAATDQSEKPAGASSESEGLEALSRAGINISQGISYCGDREGLREIIAMYHAQGAGRSRQLQQLFEEQNWKNYSITAHALKSNSRGIGANDLAELALSMEMAGKENRIEYIIEHHAEFMKKHEELLAALAENSFIYPDGCPDSGSDASGEEAGENGDTGNTDTGQVLQETDGQTLNGQIALLQEQLDNFESDGIEDILKQLESCTYHGINLNEITAKIRQSVDEFDFLGAGGVLEELKEKITGSQNGGNYD